jgi:hypothetical protein
MPIIFTHPEAVQKKLNEENSSLRDALQRAKQDVPKEGAHLVVNGQVRKIGKKSQYLLDMLTLPED